jgi:hypothetical protein
MGLAGVWGGIIRQWLEELLPADAAERCNGCVGGRCMCGRVLVWLGFGMVVVECKCVCAWSRFALCISAWSQSASKGVWVCCCSRVKVVVTKVPSLRLQYIDKFSSKEDLIHATSRFQGTPPRPPPTHAHVRMHNMQRHLHVNTCYGIGTCIHQHSHATTGLSGFIAHDAPHPTQSHTGSTPPAPTTPTNGRKTMPYAVPLPITLSPPPSLQWPACTFPSSLMAAQRAATWASNISTAASGTFSMGRTASSSTAMGRHASSIM